MSLSDLIQDVFRTLWAHRVRTLLTMFGIAWGVVSIVLMVAAGGVQWQMQEQKSGARRQKTRMHKQKVQRYSAPARD